MPPPSSSSTDTFLREWRRQRALKVGVPFSLLGLALSTTCTIMDSLWMPDALTLAADLVLMLGCLVTWAVSRRPGTRTLFGFPALIGFWLNTLPTTYGTGGLDSPFLGLNLALLFMLGIIFQERVKPWGVFVFTAANYLGWIFVNTTSWAPGLRPQPLFYSVLVTAVLVVACMTCLLAFLRTERELATETLSRSEKLAHAESELLVRTRDEERYRLTAEAIPHLVWMMDLRGQPEHFNSRWVEYTGIPLQECLEPRRVVDVFHPDDFARVRDAWAAALAGMPVLEVECRLRSAYGDYRWHLLRGTRQRDSQGRPARWIGTCTDIDDQKRAEDAAAAANQAKTSFLANISHEIRTPLGVILGYSELMENPRQPFEDRAKCLATLRRNGHQLLLLIDDLLDLSKVEAGRMEIERLPCSVPELLLDTARTFESKARDKGLDLELRVEGRIPREIVSDAMRLRQILTNIVGNAIKFTPKGKVVITTRLTARGLEFEIEDTGIGLAPSQCQHLFQPFTQADSSTTRKFGGTGLGLALSKRLAHALDGDLQLVRSSPGKGSVFSVVVGTGPLDEKSFVTRLPPEITDISESLNQHTNQNRLHGLRVLLVEDSPDNQVMVSAFLETAGAAVDLAADGIEAVAMASEGSYHVVLMDIQMPRMDGYEATAQLRSLGYRGPIVALTAHALQEQQTRCREAGCDDILTKPVVRNSLIQKIHHYAGLR